MMSRSVISHIELSYVLKNLKSFNLCKDAIDNLIYNGLKLQDFNYTSADNFIVNSMAIVAKKTLNDLVCLMLEKNSENIILIVKGTNLVSVSGYRTFSEVFNLFDTAEHITSLHPTDLEGEHFAVSVGRDRVLSIC